MSLLYPVTTSQEWCERYKLTVRSRKCPSCPRVLYTTVPFADRFGFGLISPKCACGSTATISTRVLREGVFSNLLQQEATT